MTAVTFSFGGSSVSVPWGQSFHRPHAAGFADTSTEDMRAIVAAIRSGVPWREEVDRRFSRSHPWLRDIVLSEKRQAVLELVPHTAERVLDIGSGWGQMTLPLAARGHRIAAVEPGEPRLQFIETAAAQEGVRDRIAFIGADFLECGFGPDYDAVLCIGVLEWIGAFNHNQSPQAGQRTFLEKSRSCLRPGGTMVLGIENRLGAKYLLGCPDDHLGVPHIGCLPAEMANRHWQARTGHELRCFTYSEPELRDMLRAAGFTTVRFFGAFPDYKLPEVVIPLDDDPTAIDRALATGPFIVEHNGNNGERLAPEFQERLQAFYRDVARAGAARHFVPSFFVVAQ